MKNYKAYIIVILLSFSLQTLFSQKSTQPVFVIVHGAWGGGWAFKKVDSLLSASGALVYRPTLTGQGERVHLASADIGLKTHITDVVNSILYEEIYDVILVGHSYGGMVVTGVADSISERIRKLIYIDAFVPENGESVLSIVGHENSMKEVNGFIIPPWVPDGMRPPKDVPHPYKTWTDKLSLTNKLRSEIPTSYILTVKKGVEPIDDDFASQAERAKQMGWPVLQLEADHNAQWSAPEEFVEMLGEIEQE